MEKIKIISLGGSIISPDQPDTSFIIAFKKAIESYLLKENQRRLIFVVGGGGPARIYQQAAKKINNNLKSDNLDWIGIMATRLNAQLVKEAFFPLCCDPVVTDPTAAFSFSGKILLAAGWKPGFSTDNDAVVLAKRFKAKTLINLSNIAKIYSDDPKKNSEAVALDHLSWDDYKKMIGDEWIPGRNVPFDPIATKTASQLGLKIITAAGKNIENLIQILEDKEFEGSVIS